MDLMVRTEEERKDAHRAAKRRYAERNREEIRKKNLAYYHANADRQKARNAGRREEININMKDWRARNPERFAEIQYRSQLKRKYGITPEDYDRMLGEQGGGCKLCGAPPDPTHHRKKRLHVDHCHNTGAVRGLLCITCNRQLGQVENRPEVFQRMLTYLEESMAPA